MMLLFLLPLHLPVLKTCSVFNKNLIFFRDFYSSIKNGEDNPEKGKASI